ncbi:MAG: hypothetical protein EOP84_20615 [Verrucomicrobiaceae bacterium]|nr:MAG: hypothetical protein EOP84_20615 [Verrucomicrobiaceae bacterium]
MMQSMMKGAMKAQLSKMIFFFDDKGNVFDIAQGSNVNGISKPTSLLPNGGLSCSGQCLLPAHGAVSFHLHVLFRAEQGLLEQCYLVDGVHACRLV